MTLDALPDALAGESFRVRDALRHVPYSRLWRSDLDAPAHGLRVETSLRRLSPAECFVPLLGPRQFFSHTTAAEIWGLPVPASGVVHTTTVGSGSVTRRPGFVGHRTLGGRTATTLVRGLPVSSELDAWAECATVVTVEELIMMGDHLVRVRGGHGIDELEAFVARQTGRRGSRALREALGQVRVGAESPRETRLRLRILGGRVRMPLLNCAIHDDADRFVARPDMIFGRERVCVEYDGDHHRTHRATHRDDKRRREALADAGWHTLYVSDDDLSGDHWLAFLGRLHRALARGERAARIRTVNRE